jgi:pyruvate/2-oxoglutarate/acetoin dehydrogenase E1 component/TPP-dependent pyruvate/acetoin dehydrogenase alpha subunit
MATPRTTPAGARAARPTAEERKALDLTLYQQLWRIRVFEHAVSSLHRQNKILGGVYSGEWQEALQVGFCHFLTPEDVVLPLHRDLGVFLLRGVDPGILLAQLMARRDGLSGGRDNFTHAGDLERGILGSSSMLGATLPVACGAAMRFQMLGEPHVAVSFFGEGSTARGDFHEALNFAGIHKLPVIFVCENNHYAYSTPQHLEMPVDTVAERADAYGMRGIRVNAQDLNRVLDEAEKAITRARTGDGPSLVECLTYRHHGHSEHDPARYRPEEELAEWAARDPIELFSLYLEKRGHDVEALTAEMKAAAEAEIEKAIAFAEASPLPAGEEAMRQIYYEGEPLPERVTTQAVERARIAAENSAAAAREGGAGSEAGEAAVGAPAVADTAYPGVVAGNGAGEGADGGAHGGSGNASAGGEARAAGERKEIITYLEAIREALGEEMERDPTVFILGEDVAALGGAFGVTRGLLDRFGPARVIDTPISESLILGASVGAAVLGLRPVSEMQFADFISCGFDQLVNTAATFCYRHGGRARVPMVVRLPAGGRIHGGLFHSQNPESFFLSTPGLIIVAPATVEDAKGLLKSAIRGNDPVLYLEYKSLYRRLKAAVPPGEVLTPIGEAVVRREGSDLTIVTYGPMLAFCMEAAETLEREDGARAEVIDLRTLKPLDMETVAASVMRTSRVLIAHEDRRFNGLGAEIAARIAEDLFAHLDAPVARVASADTHYAYSPPMEEWILPDTPRIVARARELLKY